MSRFFFVVAGAFLTGAVTAAILLQPEESIEDLVRGHNQAGWCWFAVHVNHRIRLYADEGKGHALAQSFRVLSTEPAKEFARPRQLTVSFSLRRPKAKPGGVHDLWHVRDVALYHLHTDVFEAPAFKVRVRLSPAFMDQLRQTIAEH